MSDPAAGQAVNEPAQHPQGLVKPSHGYGMLRAPWKKGDVPNPGGRNGEYQKTISLARKHSVEAMEKLIEKMDSEDERVSIVAAQAVLERAWGKPKDPDPKELQQSGLRLDFSKLSRDEIMLLLKITQSGAVRPADENKEVPPETIDGTATTER